MIDDQDEIIEETAILDERMELQFYINICIRCDDILGTTKVDHGTKGPYIGWFFTTKNKLPLICDKCTCFMCDECRETTNNECMEQCQGKFIPYQMFT
jgi:hypothetical protein